MEPGFRLKPIAEFRKYKRNLPHWEDPGNVYFVTFNISQELILSDASKDIVFASIEFHAGKKYKLYSCVVMDTHIHLVLQPLSESNGNYFSLASITHSIKSFSANRIQRLLKIKGKIWQDENYDRIVRGDKDFLEFMEYVIRNPVKAGLVDSPESYKWLFYEGSI